MIRKYSSWLSQLYHFLAYSVRNPRMRLEQGQLIVSIDVDAGSRKLGLINAGKNDINVNRNISEYRIGEIEEVALPLFVEFLDDLEIPVTFALRGQLVEVEDPSPIGLLLKSNVEHDIGAHGYYHRHFTNLAHDEAESELNLISVGMKRFGITPRTFVFPAGRVAHLDLLEEYGFKCYRGFGDFMSDCMYIEKKGRLFNIHPSFYVDRGANVVILKRILDISISDRLPFHIWFHLWNFGETREAITKVIEKLFLPFLTYAKVKERRGELSLETMLSAPLKIERSVGL